MVQNSFLQQYITFYKNSNCNSIFYEGLKE